MPEKLDTIVTDYFKVQFDKSAPRSMRKRNMHAWGVHVTDKEPQGYAYLVDLLRQMLGNHVQTTSNHIIQPKPGYNVITILMPGPVDKDFKLIYNNVKSVCEGIYKGEK